MFFFVEYELYYYYNTYKRTVFFPTYFRVSYLSVFLSYLSCEYDEYLIIIIIIIHRSFIRFFFFYLLILFRFSFRFFFFYRQYVPIKIISCNKMKKKYTFSFRLIFRGERAAVYYYVHTYTSNRSTHTTSNAVIEQQTQHAFLIISVPFDGW